MFRRLVTVAPRVGTVVSPRIAPALSGIQSQPSLRAPVTKRGYHEKVLDHYNNPRNVGSFNKNDADVATGLVGAPACGDVMKLQIRVDKDTNVISDVRFKTFGCGSAIASSSYLTELVRGMTLEEAGKIKNTEIARELYIVPPVKLHCSMLAEDAIKSAISNYYTKNPKARTTNLGGTGASIPNVKVEIEKSEGAAATA
ncbi:NifU-like N terminal domain-containing protein [Aspergillus bertholletiae]|uniref:Iron-sulfur cluster assembly protein n=1 Tax=Aspergillus bertholletiae TaxID=1226010 RepID=A0A5N7API6_9EURO|nr:NifU-like N terminal domain-containing protein [Aspergillus bertholletiae]